MSGIRLLAFAGSIAAALLGALYAAAADVERSDSTTRSAVAVTPIAPAARRLPEPIPEGREVPPEMAAILEADREVIVDPATGVQLGPLTLRAPSVSPEPPAPSRAAPSRAAPPRPARRARPANVPRLHPDPGRHVILTARGMMARREVVQGSCYRYLTEVFERAGHQSWRARQVAYQEGQSGPYANLDRIRPGDWLYIVNHPDRTPVGTHSVLFVSWSDRARGYANVIEHPGWGAPSAGRERTYDVSRAYRIVRPILAR